MKYIIWGAGDRGKRIFYHIGSDDVVAFIDTSLEKIGTEYCGKEVISLDVYELQYYKYPIVIAYIGEAKGIEILNNRRIRNYFLLSDCPGEFQEPNCRDILKKHIIGLLNRKCRYGIYGCTVYALKVCEWVENNCDQKPYLLIDSLVEDSLKKMIFEAGYQYIDVSEVESIEIDKILNCSKVTTDNSLLKNMNQIESINIFDCSSEIKEYYNPIIEKYRGVHKGEKCFIVATGPSLRMEDLDTLKENDMICFSMNHIWKSFDKTDWRPQYYVASDHRILQMYSKELDKMNIENIFLSDNDKDFWEKAPKGRFISYHQVNEHYEEELPKFTNDFSRKCYLGYTVTYICMQLAVYMGFKEMYLLGVDFSYGEEKDNIKYAHFFKETKLVSTGFVKQVTLAYQAAEKYAKEHNIKIYNATRGGKLEIFERVNFDDLF